MEVLPPFWIWQCQVVAQNDQSDIFRRWHLSIVFVFFVCFKRFEFEYDTNKCGRIIFFFENGEKWPFLKICGQVCGRGLRLAKQLCVSSSTHFLVNFFAVIAPLRREVAYNSTLYGEHKRMTTDFSFSFELGYFLRNSTPGGFAYII